MVVRPSPGSSSQGIWFEPHRVVHGTPQPLLAPKVTLRRLDRDVPEEELNLIQFASGQVTESRTRSRWIR